MGYRRLLENYTGLRLVKNKQHQGRAWDPVAYAEKFYLTLANF